LEPLEPLLAMADDVAEQRGSLFRDTTLWVPPAVTLGWMPRERLHWQRPDCPVNTRGQTAVIFYPPPEGWDELMPSTAVPDMGLIKAGWKPQRGVSDVFNRFLRLAAIDDKEIFKDKNLNTVADFV
jgi:hypothetical protein